ncbi:MAG TPA: hypothetical protein VLF66_03810 [Thermoanaerobaculia bacterium]|nr:hypothetical protein [Thermoanaerobaculia bacterium]
MLALETNKLETGAVVETRITLKNISDEYLFFERWSSFGTNGIDLVASSENCLYSVPPWHGTRDLGDRRFDYIPLGPGDVYETNGPAINSSMDVGLVLPGPGKYTIHAVYTSSGSLAEGLVRPIWRGMLESDAIELTLLEPAPATLALNLEALTSCLRDLDECEDFSRLSAYFSAVSSKEASDAIRGAFERSMDSPHVYPMAILLANQSSPTDADLLSELAREPSISVSTRDFLVMLAERLRDSSDCRSPTARPLE